MKYAKKLCKRLQALLKPEGPKEVTQSAVAPVLAKRPSQGLAAVQQMRQGRSSEERPSTPGNAAASHTSSGGLVKPALKPASPAPLAKQGSSGRVRLHLLHSPRCMSLVLDKCVRDMSMYEPARGFLVKIHLLTRLRGRTANSIGCYMRFTPLSGQAQWLARKANWACSFSH